MTLEWNPALGIRTRSGSIADRPKGVIDEIISTSRVQSGAEAAIVVDHSMELAAVRYTGFHRGRWTRTNAWLTERGVSEDDLDACRAAVRDRYSDDDGTAYDHERAWLELTSYAGRFAGGLRTGEIVGPERHPPWRCCGPPRGQDSGKVRLDPGTVGYLPLLHPRRDRDPDAAN